MSCTVHSDVLQNENKALKGYDGRIIECFWDSRNTTWKFLRVREDKSYPNSHVTATSKTLSTYITTTMALLSNVATTAF